MGRVCFVLGIYAVRRTSSVSRGSAVTVSIVAVGVSGPFLPKLAVPALYYVESFVSGVREKKKMWPAAFGLKFRKRCVCSELEAGPVLLFLPPFVFSEVPDECVKCSSVL